MRLQTLYLSCKPQQEVDSLGLGLGPVVFIVKPYSLNLWQRKKAMRPHLPPPGSLFHMYGTLVKLEKSIRNVCKRWDSIYDDYCSCFTAITTARRLYMDLCKSGIFV